MQRLLPVLFLALGCTDQLPNTDTHVAYIQSDCPEGGCGTNAGFVKGVPFADLDWFGEENDEGTTFESFEVLPAGTERLEVWKNELVAIDEDDPTNKKRGTLVADSTFIVKIKGVDTRIKILAVHPQSSYWARNDVDGWRLNTYRIGYQDAALPHTAPFEDLCVPDAESGMRKWDAVIFAGERYDAASKEITPSGFGWFNIACLRGAAAKALMFRHALASSAPNADPTLDITTWPSQRQAFVNAVTANYCGDGRSWTETGKLLRYRDSKGWITDPKWTWTVEVGPGSDIQSYEGVFNSLGAVCLNTPRTLTTATAATIELALAGINEHCARVGHPKIERCTPGNTYPVGWKAQGHMLTANPRPTP